MKKKLTALTLALVMMLSTAITASAATVENFNDVKTSDWYYEAVKYCAAEGIVDGTSATTYSPKGTMTRAEFVTMLYNMNGGIGWDELDNRSQNNWQASTTFTDEIPQWALLSVNWAYRYGLIKPDNDKDFLEYNFTTPEGRKEAKSAGNKFRPNDPITREEMSVILGKYATLINDTLTENGQQKLSASTDAPSVYTDANKISSSAAAYVEIARYYGLVVGDNKGNLNPASNLTRAEGAQVMMRVSQSIIKKVSGKIELPQWMVTTQINGAPVTVGTTVHISEIGATIYPIGATWQWDDFTNYRAEYSGDEGDCFTITNDGWITGVSLGVQRVFVTTPDGGTIGFSIYVVE